MASRNTESRADEHQAGLEERIRADLRRLRLLHCESLEGVAAFLGHNKDWLSKIETGKQRVYLSDYLLVLNKLRDAEPDHPAVKLADHFTRGPGRKLSVIRV